MPSVTVVLRHPAMNNSKKEVFTNAEVRTDERKVLQVYRSNMDTGVVTLLAEFQEDAWLYWVLEKNFSGTQELGGQERPKRLITL